MKTKSNTKSDYNITIENPFFINYKKQGNTHLLLWYKIFPILSVSPDWIFYIMLNIFITVLVLMYFSYFWNYFSFSIKLVGLALFCFEILTFNYSALVNPGVQIQTEILNKSSVKFCSKCNLYTSKETEHCYDCNICIEGN